MVDAARHRGISNRLSWRYGVDHQQVSRSSWDEFNSAEAKAVAGVVAHHPLGIVCKLMAGHHQQGSGFQWVASAHLVIDVLNVVGARRN